ncbi:dipeptidase, partial [Lactobacillus sp. XV13L]|nr:dipeptidase [Lactobacillus sp. XV13L]
KSLAVLVESHYPQFVQLDTDYLNELNQYYRRRVHDVIDGAEGKTGADLTAYLTKENQETVKYTRTRSEKFWGQMMIESIKMSKLTFNMDANL